MAVSTAIAVLVHFRRIRHGEGALRTVWAPAGAAALLLGALYLLIDRIEYLTAAGTGTNLLLVLLVPAVLAVGLLIAARLRRTRPDAYARFAAETAGATASAETADH
ncbi:hypothetical protein BX265_1619 [Streptomyces sp. TLI_235]|nr:hypothetical protein [Streptomyces sp. TLI_235]PBC76898.1 hypothetical protein BX265_1619 [Streptomyces sp. TLI_235]